MNKKFEHDTANCRLCAILAEGKTQTKIGREISALCPICASHHFAGGCAQPDKHICAGCRKNTRALVTEPKVGRASRTYYGEYCPACYEERGFKRLTLEAWVWYEQPAVEDDCSDDELFSSLNPNFMHAARIKS